MAKQKAALFAFNAGEVSKQALSRLDVAKMRLAAACQVNWMPWVIGPMSLRPGLAFIGEVLGDLPCHLVRFVFSKLDTALLELTDATMRVWVNEQLVTRVAVGTSIGDPFFTGSGPWLNSNTTSGASAAVSGGVATLACPVIGGLAQIEQTVSVAGADLGKRHAMRIVVTQGPLTLRVGSVLGQGDLIAQTVIDTGTHSLAFTPSSQVCIQIETTDAWNKTLTECLIEAAGVMQVPAPWAQGDLSSIRYDQSGDIVFVAAYGKAQYKIERRAVDSWSTVLYYANDGPFLVSPGIVANFTPSVYYGNGTMTSDQPWFQAGHVGALFRLFTIGQQNQAVLGAQNAYSQPVRVVGVGATARNYTWTISGTWVGKVTLSRSFDGPTSGFVDVANVTSNGTIASATGTSGGTPPLDNVIAWERVGFNAGDYTSGSAGVVSNYSGGGGYAIVRVSAFTNPKLVSIEVLSPFNSIKATTDWVEDNWSAVQGFPTSVSFHEGRLGWFGSDQAWLSASDAFTGFADINLDGSSPGDSGAINVTLGSGPVDTISWGLSLTRLLLGREQSIMSARSSNFDQPLTPTDIVIRDCSDQGAERLPAIKLGKRGIFVQQSGRKVYELAFNGQEMDYDDKDLTRLNLDIGKLGFVDIDRAIQPDHVVWLPRGDGMAAALLYDVKDGVEAWWRMMTLGVVENVAVLPTAGIEDLQYFVVKRAINGVTRRFIERLAPRDSCVGGSLNLQADSHSVYQGAPTTTLQVAHLPNSPVIVWADGASIGSTTTDASGNLTMPDGQAHSNIVVGLGGAVVSQSFVDGTGNPVMAGSLTVGTQYNGCPCEIFADIAGTGEPRHIGSGVVSGGVVSLPNGAVASTITAALGYVAPFVSAKLANTVPGAAPTSERRSIDHLGLVLYDAHYQGLSGGQRFDHMDPLPLMEAGQATPAGTVWAEFDGPMIEFPGEWNTDSRVCLLAQAPLPCTVGSVVVSMDVTS